MIMSNNNDYVRNLTDYITDITGIQTEVYPLATKEKDKLPLLVTGVYDLHGGMIMGVPVVFAKEKDGNRLTPSQIGKHMDIIKHSTGYHAIYVTQICLLTMQTGCQVIMLTSSFLGSKCSCPLC